MPVPSCQPHVASTDCEPCVSVSGPANVCGCDTVTGVDQPAASALPTMPSDALTSSSENSFMSIQRAATTTSCDGGLRSPYALNYLVQSTSRCRQNHARLLASPRLPCRSGHASRPVEHPPCIASCPSPAGDGVRARAARVAVGTGRVARRPRNPVRCTLERRAAAAIRDRHRDPQDRSHRGRRQAGRSAARDVAGRGSDTAATADRGAAAARARPGPADATRQHDASRVDHAAEERRRGLQDRASRRDDRRARGEGLRGPARAARLRAARRQAERAGPRRHAASAHAGAAADDGAAGHPGAGAGAHRAGRRRAQPGGGRARSAAKSPADPRQLPRQDAREAEARPRPDLEPAIADRPCAAAGARGPRRRRRRAVGRPRRHGASRRAALRPRSPR